MSVSPLFCAVLVATRTRSIFAGLARINVFLQHSNSRLRYRYLMLIVLAAAMATASHGSSECIASSSISGAHDIFRSMNGWNEATLSQRKLQLPVLVPSLLPNLCDQPKLKPRTTPEEVTQLLTQTSTETPLRFRGGSSSSSKASKSDRPPRGKAKAGSLQRKRKTKKFKEPSSNNSIADKEGKAAVQQVMEDQDSAQVLGHSIR